MEAVSQSSPAQEKVAKTVTSIVLIGTCLLGALGISMAIVSMSAPGGSVDEAKNIMQILFSAILPLFGTWIGTILAYYFSKENLAAANQTVQHLVNTITSDRKLQAIKARDAMMTLDKIKYIEYKTSADDTSFNLKETFLKSLNENGIQRVILLDENKCAKYVIHKSTIQEFITNQAFNAPGKPVKELSFADMKKSEDKMIQAILKDGVKFINENANLSDAKVLIKNYAACADVFVTKNGSANEPVLGWITDKTISENSIVDAT